MPSKHGVRFLDAIDVMRPPPDRGRLWYDFEIADAFFRGLPGIALKVRWVREHLPRGARIKIGRHSAWYEYDVLAYLEAAREDTRARRARDGQ
ncbi:MAG TPA: hypothetical protein VFS08_08805, partial [Gemmatimonadaceae bacterium]|nr:hypothetical protein [Gemmatimonadaceae bacterium]